MLEYKIDVLQALKEKGYNTTKIRADRLLSEKTVQEIRTGKVVGTKSIDTLCKLLCLQPGSIIRYVPEPEPEKP